MDDICKETGERHVPDWGTVSVYRDSDRTFIDVICGSCGRRGCVGNAATLIEQIVW